MRFGLAILLPTRFESPVRVEYVDYFSNVMNECVSCVYVLKKKNLKRERDFINVPDLFFTSWSENDKMTNNNLDNMLYLCSIFLMLEDLHFTGPINHVWSPKSEKWWGFV